MPLSIYLEIDIKLICLVIGAQIQVKIRDFLLILDHILGRVGVFFFENSLKLAKMTVFSENLYFELKI